MRLALALLAACGGSNATAPANDFACDAAVRAWRCDGNVVQQCVAGAWTAGADCSASSQECKDTGSLAFCGLPRTECTVQGFVGASASGYAADEVFDEYQV